MQILWIKRPSLGVVLIDLIMVCGYLFLILLILFMPASLKNGVEGDRVLLNQVLPFFIPLPQELPSPGPPFDHLIRDVCRQHSVEPALVMAVIQAESQFDPLAVSPRGAMGLMQLSPLVTRAFGVHDPFNPRLNINGGVRYLKNLLKVFNGDRELALAAYNAGPTQVYRHKGVPPFKETRKYISQVFRYLSYYQKTPVS
jgi:soluble lytic murein transglycosylase-like protein